MENSKARIRDLYEKTARRRQLEAELADLNEQREELAYNAEVLRNVMELEEADVKKLEKASISNFFTELFGNMGEKINKERREAYEAALKYRSAVGELEFVEKEITQRQAELSGLEDCEAQLEKEIADAMDAAKTDGSENGAKIVELEKRILEQHNKIRELNEAISAGRFVIDGFGPVIENLNSAQSWGTWDLFGGGLISSIAKHEKLGQAQAELENLQIKLRSFRTELSDVKINADLNISMDEFTTFADWFFDGFFVDSMILDKIHRAKDQVYDLQQQIYRLIDSLEASLRQAETEKSRLKAALEQIVAG